MTKLAQIFSSALTRLSRYEPLVLVLFALASGGAFLFVRLMGEMLEGETWAFDAAILRALRLPEDVKTPIGPAWLTKSLTDLTALGGVTVLTLVTTFAVLFLLIVGRRRVGLFVLISVLGGWLVSTAVKVGVARPRPDVVTHLVDVHDWSFPSGHAMLSAVTYLTIGALLAQTQPSRAARYFLICCAVFLTLVIGVSRVFLGVHYPTDVLGGWTAGSTWACMCWLVARRFITTDRRQEDPA